MHWLSFAVAWWKNWNLWKSQLGTLCPISNQRQYHHGSFTGYFKDNNGKKAVSITSFSSATKYSSATFDKETFVLGAPEFCSSNPICRVSKGNEKYSAQGYRVLVYGKYHGVVESGKPLSGKVDAYGLVLLSIQFVKKHLLLLNIWKSRRWNQSYIRG